MTYATYLLLLQKVFLFLVTRLRLKMENVSDKYGYIHSLVTFLISII